MTDNTTLIARVRFSAALALVCLAGCHSAARRSADLLDSRTFEQVVIRYNVNGAERLTGPLSCPDAVLPVAGTIGCDGAISLAELSIEYPHPQYGFARAQVQLRLSEESAMAANDGHRLITAIGRQIDLPSLFAPIRHTASEPAIPGNQDEIWTLDITRKELTTILDDLAVSGFFEDQTRSSGTAELSVQVDRQRNEKTWTAEPVLDELIRRVHSEGQLAGFLPSQLASR